MIAGGEAASGAGTSLVLTGVGAEAGAVFIAGGAATVSRLTMTEQFMIKVSILSNLIMQKNNFSLIADGFCLSSYHLKKIKEWFDWWIDEGVDDWVELDELIRFVRKKDWMIKAETVYNYLLSLIQSKGLNMTVCMVFTLKSQFQKGNIPDTLSLKDASREHVPPVFVFYKDKNKDALIKDLISEGYLNIHLSYELSGQYDAYYYEWLEDDYYDYETKGYFNTPAYSRSILLIKST